VYSLWVIPTLVFLVLVVFGSFFLLKLLLAVIWDKFASVQAQIDISKEAEALQDNLTQVSGQGSLASSSFSPSCPRPLCWPRTLCHPPHKPILGFVVCACVLGLPGW
jgi:hypothetical protein